MQGSLAGRRCVVTGALGGIGMAASAALRNRGAEVVGIDLRDGDGVVAGDVTDRDSVVAAVEEAAHRLGGIDVLVNNAGIGIAQDAGDFPDAAARRVLEVNLLGVWTTTAAALPHLLRSPHRGHVVNVSSGLGVVSMPYAAAYAASKRGVLAYSDTLRLEYRGRLTVTSVLPGYIRTTIHDAPARQGVSLEGLVNADSVHQAAAAVVRACERRPRQLSTSRTTALGVATARHLPRLVDAVVGWSAARRERQRPRPSFLRDVEAEPGGTAGVSGGDDAVEVLLVRPVPAEPSGDGLMEAAGGS